MNFLSADYTLPPAAISTTVFAIDFTRQQGCYRPNNSGIHSCLLPDMTPPMLPTDQWYANIGDNTLADAILDRLMHNAHRLILKGESMRKIMSSLTQVEHLG